MSEPQPTESFLYKCVFCKTERVSYWTPNPIFTLAKWQSKMACNRCADYHHTRIGLCEKIAKICRVLGVARTLSSKELSAITAATDTKLVELTRKLARAACEHAGVAMLWEREFVDLLIQSPEKQHLVVGKYLSGLRQLL